MRFAIASLFLALSSALPCNGAEPASVTRVDRNTLIVKGNPPALSAFKLENLPGVTLFKKANIVVLRSSPAITDNRQRQLTEAGAPQGLIAGGGSQALRGDYPWQVGLVDKIRLDPLAGQFCGGVIVDQRHILTAAHCVWLAKTRDHTIQHATLGIVAGQVSLARGVEVLDTDYITVHESWQREETRVRFDNDLAIVELQKPLVFGDYVKPAPFASLADDQLIAAGMGVRVVGWGLTNAHDLRSRSRNLLWADIQVLDNLECARIPGYGGLTANMFCALLNGTGACAGDSGGAIISREVFPAEVVGIVSWTRSINVQGWNIACTTPGNPGVYVKVSNYRDWIAAHSRVAVAAN